MEGNNAIQFNVNALPAVQALQVAAEAAGQFSRIIKMTKLYEDLRRASVELMKLHDFSDSPESEWFEALQRMESALNAISDFEREGRPLPGTFEPGGVSFDVGTQPSVTVEVFRDEAGNIIDSHEKYKEWHHRPKKLESAESAESRNKRREQIIMTHKCNATCEDIGCQCGREEALRQAGLS